jgi:hypothetical protein
VDALVSLVVRGSNTTYNLFSPFIAAAAQLSHVPQSEVLLTVLVGTPENVVASSFAPGSIGDGGFLGTSAVIGAAVGAAVVLLLFCVLGLTFLMRRRKKKQKRASFIEPGAGIGGVNPIFVRQGGAQAALLNSQPPPRLVVVQKSAGATSGPVGRSLTPAAASLHNPVFAASAGRIIKSPTPAHHAATLRSKGTRMQESFDVDSSKSETIPYVNPIRTRDHAVSSASSTRAAATSDATLEGGSSITPVVSDPSLMEFKSNPLRGKRASSRKNGTAGGVESTAPAIGSAPHESSPPPPAGRTRSAAVVV